MKNIFYIFCLFLLSSPVIAQNMPDFNNYQPLRCAGEIPEDFRILSQNKYKDAVKEEAKTSKGHSVNSSKQQFLLETNYVIDELLLSGKVLFGDTVTNYVNAVADRVLVNQPELRGKLRFYCLKSSEVNAFSTNQGIVFITLGLIAQLENEAQLAYIISHEVAHYERHHTMNEYLKNQEIFSENSGYKYNTYDEQIRNASSYSKELELEADSLGLIRLSKTGYDCDEAISSFFVMQFSELPFEDYEFSGKFLENDIMKLPQDLFLDSVKKINLEGDMEDDSYSTHPNIATRRNRAESILGNLSGCGNQKFAASADAFYFVRKITRFETVRIMLNRRNYCDALYNAYILQKEDSSSLYLKICVGKALYGMTKYKNHGSFSEVTSDYRKKEGNQQQCFYLFRQLTATQLNMVALRYLYNLSAIDSSYTIKLMIADLTDEAVRINNIHYSDMEKTFKLFQETKKMNADSVNKLVTKIDSASNLPPTDTQPHLSKYDKLRKEKKEQEHQQAVESKKSEVSKYYLLAFADILENPSVKSMFEVAESKSAERIAQDKIEQEKIDNMSSYEYRKMQQKEENIDRKDGLCLGIDTVVYVDPFYYMADDRKGLKLIQSETQQLEFSNQIQENANYSGLNIDILNPKSFNAQDVERYNDLAAINDWMGERLDHDDDLEMIPLETDRMIPLVQKYHTTHFCYTGIYTYKQKREDRGFIIFFSIICYPVLPFGLAYAFTPEHHTYYYTLMYNVETGKPDVKRTIHLRSKSKTGFINSIMYDMMLQIKHQKKAKTIKR